MTAAMSVLDVWIDDTTLGGRARVGQLDRMRARVGEALSFEYDGTWLDGTGPVPGFELDPDLPLYAGRIHAPAGAASLTGAFQDCSPDRWGRVLMDRREAIEARAAGRRPVPLRDWDYLVGVHDHARMGALRLREPGTDRYVDDRRLAAPPLAELRTLEEYARRLEEDPDAPLADQQRWLAQLLAPGSSLGGARPKASFSDTDGSLWLAKFPSTEDRHDVGLWELVMHRLAIDAGIDMPPARKLALSGHGHTFAVARFDRTGESRRAFASAMTLLGADDSTGFSYLDLADLVSRVGASGTIAANLEQLFRRMVFNVLVANRDDHLRNHGFLREGNGWILSPAFDVNPNPYKDGHALGVCFEDPAPAAASLLEMRDFFRLSADGARSILDDVRQAVGRWDSVARDEGASRGEIAGMSAVIDPAR